MSPLSGAKFVGRAPARRDNHGDGGVGRAVRGTCGKEDFRARDTARRDEVSAGSGPERYILGH